MDFFKKLHQRLHDGSLRDLWRETRWIYRYVRCYRKSILLYVLLGLAATVVSLGASLASKYLIDIIETHLRGSTYGVGALALAAALCIFLAISNILLSSLSSRYSTKINLRVSNEIRADVYRKFLQTDMESVQAFHSGDLLNRINTDVTNVADSVLGWVPTLIIKLVQFAAALVIILIYDPTMAVFALLAAPISLIASRFLLGRMRSYNRRMREVNSEVMAFHEESLQNIQPIKALNLTDIFYGKILRLQQKYYDTALEYNRFSVLTSMFMSLVGIFVSYACLGWAAYRLWSGVISFGTMVLFIQLASYLSSAFSSLVNLIPSAISATVSARRIMSVLDLPREELPDLETAKALAGSGAPMSLVLEALCFGYHGGETVLEGLSLCVCSGETVAIVGPSGTGKTTLFRILLGLLHPQSGVCKIESAACTLPLSPSTRVLFSYVPQDSVVFSGTVADSLRLGKPSASEAELWQALEAACAADFVRKLPKGLDSALSERGGSLSGGQVQRLAIARALLTDAPILLLDEVTAALDLQTERQVLANIARVYHGRTCIVATHRPSVLRLCSAVYRIENRRLVRLTPEALAAMSDPQAI